jgi:serine/threonine protein kinase
MTDMPWTEHARVIADRYRLERPIGQGGMGEVWAGYDIRLDRRIAVKLMKPPPAPGPLGAPSGPAAALRAEQAQAAENARLRFLREVQTTAALAHPGIPAVHDTGTDEATGDLYVVMQLLTGAELADLIAEHDYEGSPPPLAWAAAIGAQVAAVLSEVHLLSVVHRDIKPRNLFLTPGGIVKVLDFGVAALLGAGELTKLTMVGQTVGTPPYMAPEQALASTVGPPADLYALGCVLHEMLTGQLPFTPSDGVSVQWHHVHTPPPPVTAIRPGIPADVETLILRLLSKSPDERPGPDEVYDALLHYASDSTASLARSELDPTRPFIRPMAATPHRGTPAPAPLAVGPTTLSPSEAQSVTERAADLAQAGQFTQATDILTAAIGRCAADAALAGELRFSLANVLFLAGSYRRALTEFETAGAQLAEQYGAADALVQDCRYYAATCQAALGENTDALASFRAFLADPLRAAGDRDDRVFDARRQVGLLLASAGRHQEALTSLQDLRRDLIAVYGESSAEVAEVSALLASIERYDSSVS